MEEPMALTAIVAEQLAALPQDSPVRAALAAMLDAHRRNQQRRRRVLSHEDLRKRLQAHPLNFTRADRWNGYVPPAMVNVGESEIIRSARVVQNGALQVRYNQLGKRSEGAIPNDSAQRAALVEISMEAMQREQED